MLTGTLSSPVVEVQILNPYNPQETLNDKLSIIDVNKTGNPPALPG